MRVSPELVIEVISPDETRSVLEEKLHDYFGPGHKSPGSWTDGAQRRDPLGHRRPKR